MRQCHPQTRSLAQSVLLVGVILLFVVSTPPSWSVEQDLGVYAEWVRVVQDDSGNLHLVYAWDYGGTYYMKFNGSSWIGPTYLPNSSDCWFAFTMPDIAVGPDGIPQVVYGIRTGDYPNDLEYFYYAKANNADGTSWPTPQVIGGDNDTRENHARIAVDANNQPHIVFMQTNKYDTPYWWRIIYLRPDGYWKIIATGWDGDRVNNPGIAFDRDNTIVHIAYYKGGWDTGNTNIWHAWDNPYGDFPIEQISNMGYNWQVSTPDIGIDPNNWRHIAYMVADWNIHYFMGIHVNGYEVDGGTAAIDEGHEDFGPGIDFTPTGDRCIVWSYYTRGEAYYKINDEPKQILSPAGHIDVCGGAGGAHYVRVGSGGHLYWDQIIQGGPTFYPPTAVIDNITPNPVERGVHFMVSFFGTAYDNDENGQSIATYEWASNLDGEIGSSEDLSIPPINLQPGEHAISYRVQDDEGEWSATDYATLEVLADTIPPSPVTQIDVQHDGEDTLVITWSGAADNLAMSRYDVYRATEAWFSRGTLIGQVDAAAFPLVLEDGNAFVEEDEAYYLIVPVDVDGNMNWDGARVGAYRYSLEDAATQ